MRGRLGRDRLARRDPRAIGDLALPRAPALQGNARAHGAPDRRGGRRGRGRHERLHDQGVHDLLRACPRRARGARPGRPLRHPLPAGASPGGGRRRAPGDPRRGPHAPRRAFGRRPGALRGRDVPRPHPRAGGARGAGGDHRGLRAGDPLLLRHALSARQHGHRRSRRPRPRGSSRPPSRHASPGAAEGRRRCARRPRARRSPWWSSRASPSRPSSSSACGPPTGTRPTGSRSRS